MAEREIQEWQLVYTDWDPDEQPLRPALGRAALGEASSPVIGSVAEAVLQSASCSVLVL